jgi:hypothetical protein
MVLIINYQRRIKWSLVLVFILLSISSIFCIPPIIQNGKGEIEVRLDLEQISRQDLIGNHRFATNCKTVYVKISTKINTQHTILGIYE